MRLVITGHRLQKLTNYDLGFIQFSIDDLVSSLQANGVSLAYSGMADGVDLWFCQACKWNKLSYIACIPFEGQDEYMSKEDVVLRETLIADAASVMKVRNSWMVEHADIAIVVWDANKGGTHNVVQQLVEKNIPFYWINPVGKKVWHCA